MGIYNSGIIYMLGFSSTSDQPMPTDQPSTFVVPRFAQVQQAIDDMIASVVVVPMTGAELSGSELTGMMETGYTTTDQKTYSNSTYGFEFKYPNNFFITWEGGR